MKRKTLVDIKITCDPPRLYYFQTRTLEDLAKEYESWVKEFHSFIRDHRSQDPVTLNVEREYQDLCSFCGSIWDEDELGQPLCCSKAVEEFEAAKLSANIGRPSGETPGAISQ